MTSASMRERSSSQAASDTGVPRWGIWPTSKAAASTTGPRRWKESSARSRRSFSWAPGIPPARRPCICRAELPKSGFSRGRRHLGEHVAVPRGPHQRPFERGGSHACTRSRTLEGRDGILEAIHWRVGSGENVRRQIRHLFLFVGADPETEWLSKSGVALDPKGFVLTGDDANNGRRLFETSVAGIFAIGDVRAGSIKRVAAGVGEGAQVVAALHAYLASNNHARSAS